MIVKTAELPEWAYKNCNKCGKGVFWNLKYIPPDYSITDQYKPERIKWTCKMCGYVKYTKTKDAE